MEKMKLAEAVVDVLFLLLSRHLASTLRVILRLLFGSENICRLSLISFSELRCDDIYEILQRVLFHDFVLFILLEKIFDFIFSERSSSCFFLKKKVEDGF